MPTKQAEAITNTIMEVLNDSLVNVSKTFVSKVEMQGEIQEQKREMQKVIFHSTTFAFVLLVFF